ncbi:MAG: hypothetical protein IKZ58_05430 [Selenomonadaceae bacterium]|nr:hypothetical protein [Selenomonadaceae bacterium]
MKNFLTMLIAAMIFSTGIASAAREDNPTCVLMKFTDDTRYDAINSADRLSDLVLEKMIASKKFNLKEFEPIDENLEARLYDEKVDEFTNFDTAISSNDYNEFFEGDGFQENKAQSIATASVGQIVTPEITSEIGKNHGAEYLIQGTIINLGTGAWMNEDLEIISGAVAGLAAAYASYASNIVSGSFGDVMGGIGGVNMTIKGIGVQCDIRIIKAATGEVIWSKRVLGIGESQLISVGLVTFGHSNLSDALYSKAINKAADKIVDALLEDMKDNSLFVR